MKPSKADGKLRGSSSGSVLVVDDSRLVRLFVRAALKSGGYDVDEAEGGCQALEMFSKSQYDVVITDMNMPEVNGFGVLSGVKRLAPDVEVIILTGTHAADMDCAVRALRLGAHDYLSKPPSSPNAILHTVDLAIEKKRLKEANQRLVRELDQESRSDALTGALNRRSLDEALTREIGLARRHGHALGTVMLDIDHFKNVNDTYGHQAGDDVLRSFARVVASTLREGDLFFRYGGEEFVVVLPHTDRKGALMAAERIVAAIAAAPMSAGTATLPITSSAGVACLTQSTQDGAALIAEADAALYEAKKNGRNRVVASRLDLTLVGASGR